VPEVDPLTIEERFTRDLTRRRAIVITQYGGDEEAYLTHFFAGLAAESNSTVEVVARPRLPRPTLAEKQARRAARKAKRYADPPAFPFFKKPEQNEWKFRKADRVIHHQAPTQTWHFCSCGEKPTRFVGGRFDSKVWMCARCFPPIKNDSTKSRLINSLDPGMHSRVHT
jgi:hypothetical protein